MTNRTPWRRWWIGWERWASRMRALICRRSWKANRSDKGLAAKSRLCVGKLPLFKRGLIHPVELCASGESTQEHRDCLVQVLKVGVLVQGFWRNTDKLRMGDEL